MRRPLHALLVLAFIFAGTGKAAAAAVAPSPVVRSAAGANPAEIQPAVDQFRADLGEPLNPSQAVPSGSGRREINWDGVPGAQSAPNGLPAEFFNATSPRGVVLSTPGTGFEVSASMGLSTPAELGNLDPTYPTAFQPFSPQKLFTPLGSTTTVVSFVIPGTSEPATVNGFGAVFTDVDLPGSASIQLFDKDGDAIGSSAAPTGTFDAPAKPAGADNESLSFVGVTFSGRERIARVRITSGATPLGTAPDVTQAGGPDVVALDDLLFGEPKPSFFLLSSSIHVDENAGVAPVIVERSGGGGAATVDVITSDYRAKAGSDYTGTSTTLSFAPGERNKVAAIPITADGEREPDEYFYFTLANATGSGAIVSPSFGSVTIHDATSPVAPDTTPPAGSMSGVPAKMRLKDFLKGVAVKVDRVVPASISATLEGRAEQAKLAAAFNLSLASKTVARAAGVSRFRLKPSRRLVGKATKLTARVRVVLTDAAGSRRTLSRTFRVRR